MGNKEYWNKVHNKYKNNDIIYDNWLDEYKSLILFAQKPILCEQSTFRKKLISG